MDRLAARGVNLKLGVRLGFDANDSFESPTRRQSIVAVDLPYIGAVNFSPSEISSNRPIPTRLTSSSSLPARWSKASRLRVPSMGLDCCQSIPPRRTSCTFTSCTYIASPVQIFFFSFDTDLGLPKFVGGKSCPSSSCQSSKNRRQSNLSKSRSIVILPSFSPTLLDSFRSIIV